MLIFRTTAPVAIAIDNSSILSTFPTPLKFTHSKMRLTRAFTVLATVGLPLAAAVHTGCTTEINDVCVPYVEAQAEELCSAYLSIKPATATAIISTEVAVVMLTTVETSTMAMTTTELR